MFTTLAIQSWTLYAVSISLIFSRLIFRRITLRCFRRFQADDWLMLLALLPYTASIVAANQVGDAQLPMERKFRYVLEEMQLITIWLVKACFLVLYWRIFPIQTNLPKRRLLQGVSAFCCASFLIVQSSLMLWCRPTESYWDMSTTNPQCTSYHNHTALTLSFDIPNTLLIMILPVPFIPTPRRVLLAILLLLGTLVLIISIISRTLLLTTTISSPKLPTYLHYYTSESSLSIIFANLPFLTSLVVTATPARIRQLSLSQWPRSRRGSWETDVPFSPFRSTRFNSSGSAVTGIASPRESKKTIDWHISTGALSDGGNGGARNSGGCSPTTKEMEPMDLNSSQDSKKVVEWNVDVKRIEDRGNGSGIDSGACSPTTVREVKLVDLNSLGRRDDQASRDRSTSPRKEAQRERRESPVPKTRLSGGLAEMGELRLQDEAQGWPIHWR